MSAEHNQTLANCERYDDERGSAYLDKPLQQLSVPPQLTRLTNAEISSGSTLYIGELSNGVISANS